jgi:hypothetical protein
VSFTGVLTVSQGYTLTAVSGTYSSYQPVTTATLSNFTLTAVGFATLTFAGSLPITPGRNEALVATVDTSGNPVLLLADEGSVSGLGAPSAPAAPLSLSSQPSGTGSLRFAPASPALAPR